MSEEKFIKQMNTLTDATCLKIIYLLNQGDFCSIHLEKLLNVSQPNISRHVFKMVDAKIVSSYKRERRNIYFITDEFKQNHQTIINMINEVYHDEIDLSKFEEYQAECKTMK